MVERHHLFGRLLVVSTDGTLAPNRQALIWPLPSLYHKGYVSLRRQYCIIAFLSEQGMDLSILDGLRKERGRQSSTSAAFSRRRHKRLSKSRLPAARIAAALGTQPVVPLEKPSSPPHVWVPKRTVGAEAQPDTGRHRGPDTSVGHRVAPPDTAGGSPRHARVSRSTTGEIMPVVPVRQRRTGVAPAPNARVRVAPAPVDAASGRHRPPTPSKRRILAAPRGSLGIQAHLRLFVAVGVVALVIVVAMMFGVRVVVSRSSAQTQLVATTPHNLVGSAAAKSLAVPRDVMAKPHASAR